MPGDPSRQRVEKTGKALHHKLCHVLGGTFGLTHAETHAIILPHAIASNETAVPDLPAPVAALLGGPAAGAARDRLAAASGAPLALQSLGLGRQDLDRAAEVAQELIVDDEIDLMLVASTPETTNPVTTTCENEGVPVISTVAPRQTRFIGQQGNPGDPASWQPFDDAVHVFRGLEDVIAVFTSMWGHLRTNRSAGGLFPDDGDGTARGDPVAGFPPGLSQLGYRLKDPGLSQNLTDDFTAQINAFRQASVEIVTGVVIAPDLTTFRTQARQQGFTPKAASIGKAILFPQAVEAPGDTRHNLSSKVWRSPTHPFASSRAGQSAGQRAEGFTAATGRQWTQPIGFVHALFEVAADAMARVFATATAIAILVVSVAALAAAPAVASRGMIRDLFFILTMLTRAQFRNLRAGQGGLVSVGQQAFVGMGAQALHGAVILGGAGLAALALAVPTAFFAFRLQGASFAIGPRRKIEDLTGDRTREIADSGGILVRPDPHVALRGEAMTANPAADLRRALATIPGR